MKLRSSFSTLACPAWTVNQIVDAASQWNYDGIAFRVVLGELDLWKLPAFHGSGLAETRRLLADWGLTLPCIDASAHFDSPDEELRKQSMENAEHIAEVAHALGSSAVRVFGDRVQPGATRDDTVGWIAESLLTLEQKLAPAKIAVWLETHGDFSQAQDVAELMTMTMYRIPVIWDPANALEEFGERPGASETAFGGNIRHVHLKDFRGKREGDLAYVLTGEGEMPFDEIRQVLERLDYDGFVSFEWEKQWHPSLADASVALPHFSNWFQTNWRR